MFILDWFVSVFFTVFLAVFFAGGTAASLYLGCHALREVVGTYRNRVSR